MCGFGFLQLRDRYYTYGSRSLVLRYIGARFVALAYVSPGLRFLGYLVASLLRCVAPSDIIWYGCRLWALCFFAVGGLLISCGASPIVVGLAVLSVGGVGRGCCIAMRSLTDARFARSVTLAVELGHRGDEKAHKDVHMRTCHMFFFGKMGW